MGNPQWKKFERDAAALFGGKRFWANAGERIDFEGSFAVGQCKLVKQLSLSALTALAEEIAEEGRRRHKLGVVVVKLRRGKGRESQALVVLTTAHFDEWFSMRERKPDVG